MDIPSIALHTPQGGGQASNGEIEWTTSNPRNPGIRGFMVSNQVGVAEWDQADGSRSSRKARVNPGEYSS